MSGPIPNPYGAQAGPTRTAWELGKLIYERLESLDAKNTFTNFQLGEALNNGEKTLNYAEGSAVNQNLILRIGNNILNTLKSNKEQLNTLSKEVGSLRKSGGLDQKSWLSKISSLELRHYVFGTIVLTFFGNAVYHKLPTRAQKGIDKVGQMALTNTGIALSEAAAVGGSAANTILVSAAKHTVNEYVNERSKSFLNTAQSFFSSKKEEQAKGFSFRPVIPEANGMASPYSQEQQSDLYALATLIVGLSLTHFAFSKISSYWRQETESVSSKPPTNEKT